MAKKVTIFSILLHVISIFTFLYYWEPTRVYWKNFVSKNPYKYSQLDPVLLETDPASLITINDIKSAMEKRAALKNAIFSPELNTESFLPDMVFENINDEDVLDEIFAKYEEFLDKNEDEEIFPKYDGMKVGYCSGRGRSDAKSIDATIECNIDKFKDIKNLERIDALFMNVGDNARIESDYFERQAPWAYETTLAHFIPKQANGRVVIYQHGRAGTYILMHRYIETLLNRGYSVIAANYFGYGNTSNFAGVDELEQYFIEHPLRINVYPIMAAVNYAKQKYDYKSIDLIGFSSGAWAIVAASAIDQRIRNSYSIAGSLPRYLSVGNEIIYEMRNRKLRRAASNLDMYVLTALEPGRRHMQVFNRYDRCCFNNTKGKIYEPAVRDALVQLGRKPEDFSVYIDETHARHKISSSALDEIIKHMEEGGQ